MIIFGVQSQMIYGNFSLEVSFPDSNVSMMLFINHEDLM